MMRTVLVTALLATVAPAQESLVMPLVIGQDLYHGGKALRRMGLVIQYLDVKVDSPAVADFYIVGQKPDSGTPIRSGDTVSVEFSCSGMLRYWNQSVVYLLGDFANTVGFYKVQQPPLPITIPEATYPADLLRYTFSGKVDVEALVDFDGSVLAARVVNSSGYESADSSACEAALHSSFSPARQDGEPVRVWFPLPFAFNYKELKNLPGPGEKPGADPFEP